MAQITIHVPAFDYTWEGPATEEDEVWDNVDQYDLGDLAIDKAVISSAILDKPEPEDNSSDEEEEDSEVPF